MRLKILSYNIHSGVGIDGVQSYQRIGRFLAAQAIDIALLQEMDTRPAQRNIIDDEQAICADHFTWLARSPTLHEPYGWYGNTILSRFPIIFEHTVDISQHGRQPRNIQEAVIDVESHFIRVINTHKGLRKLERRRQLDLLNQHLCIDGEYHWTPIVLAGDFNEWQLFSKAFRHINTMLIPHPLPATFPTRCPLFRLDRAWSKPGSLVSKARVLKTPETRIYSDHFPVLLDVDLPGSPGG